MTESDIWKFLRVVLTEADLCRHEDRSRPGIPDVSYGLLGVNGWIELKAYPACSGPSVVPPFSNLKKIQKRWLKRRGESGGRCFVLAAFGDSMYLFPWWSIPELGVSTMEELSTIAAAVTTKNKHDYQSLIDALTAPNRKRRFKT